MSPPAGQRMYSSQNCVPLWQLQTDYVQHVFIYSIFIDLYAVCLYINTVRHLKCLLFPRIFSVLTVYLLQQRNKLTRMKPSVSRLLLSLTWVNMKQQWDAVTSQLIGTRWHHSSVGHGDITVFKLALRPDRPESSSLFSFLHQRMNDCVNSIRNSSNQIFFFILLCSNSFFFFSSVSSLRLLVLFIYSSCFRLFPPRPRLCALSDATWHLTSEVSVWMCDIIIDDSAVFIFYIKWKWAQVLLRLSLILVFVQKMKAVEVKTLFKLRSQVNDLVMLKEQFTTKWSSLINVHHAIRRSCSCWSFSSSINLLIHSSIHIFVKSFKCVHFSFFLNVSLSPKAREDVLKCLSLFTAVLLDTF